MGDLAAVPERYMESLKVVRGSFSLAEQQHKQLQCPEAKRDSSGADFREAIINHWNNLPRAEAGSQAQKD